jgi:Cft2 family RNA processing exonuclease
MTAPSGGGAEPAGGGGAAGRGAVVSSSWRVEFCGHSSWTRRVCGARPPEMRVAFTTLAGARTTTSRACCHVLELDNLTVLLDCGWDDSFDTASLKALAEVAPRVDVVLLTHGDLEHVGALAYARARLGLTAPIYATLPVCKMGLMHVYDAHAYAAAHDPGFDERAFPLDAVDAAFAAVHELKFSQLVKLRSVPGTGVATIAPHPAGHTIGGCFWRVTVGAEEILYCPEYNHTRERHLPPGTLHTYTKPTLLIAPAGEALAAADRGAPRAIVEYATAALARNGDVLIPSDAAGRCLELLLLMESHWRRTPHLHSRPVVLLSATAGKTLAFARSQLEWMGEEAVKTFDSRARAENIFELRHVCACHSLRELSALPSPKVVIATSTDLTSGYAAELLPAILSQPSGLLLLTRRSPELTPAHLLSTTPTPKHVTIPVYERVPLEGAELAAHEAAVAARAAAAEEARLAEVEEARAIAEAAEAAEEEAAAAAAEAAEKAAFASGGAAPAPMQIEVGVVDPIPAVSMAAVTAEEAKRMTVPQLKAELEKANLDQSGLKAVLQQRLLEHIASQAGGKVSAVGTGRDGGGGASSDARSPYALARSTSALTPRTPVGATALVGGGGGGARQKPSLMRPHVERFGERTEHGVTLEEDEIRRMEEGARALTAVEIVKGGVDGGGGGSAAARTTRAALVGTAGGSAGADVDMLQYDDDDDDDDEEEEGADEQGECESDAGGSAAGEETPSKWMRRSVEVAVRCAVRTVLLEGRSDGRSIKAVLAQIAPLTTVLVGGDDASTNHLAEHCHATVLGASSAEPRVLAPMVGESVDGSSHMSMYAVKLSDAMLRTLRPRRLGPYEVQRISGVLAVPRAESGVTATSGVSGVLEPLEGRRRAGGGSVDFVSKGDVRLAELKQQLARAGHRAEFVDGALVVNTSVRVVKDGAQGRFLIEGAYGEDYLRVRELLYGQVEAI